MLPRIGYDEAQALAKWRLWGLDVRRQMGGMLSAPDAGARGAIEVVARSLHSVSGLIEVAVVVSSSHRSRVDTQGLGYRPVRHGDTQSAVYLSSKS